MRPSLNSAVMVKSLGSWLLTDQPVSFQDVPASEAAEVGASAGAGASPEPLPQPATTAAASATTSSVAVASSAGRRRAVTRSRPAAGAARIARIALIA